MEFKNATGDQLEFGELALNYNESGPYLQCKDADGEVINLGGVYLSESAQADAPGDPLPGRMWLRYDTLFIWDGDNWVQIGNTGGGGGDPGQGGGVTLTIIGGDGIEAVTVGSTVTITADVNESRGLDIVGDQIAVKLGAGLSLMPTASCKQRELAAPTTKARLTSPRMSFPAIQLTVTCTPTSAQVSSAPNGQTLPTTQTPLRMQTLVMLSSSAQIPNEPVITTTTYRPVVRHHVRTLASITAMQLT